MSRKVLALIVSSVLLVGTVGCVRPGDMSQDNRSVIPSHGEASDADVRIIAHGLYPYDHGESMERMLHVYPHVVVGVVKETGGPVQSRSQNRAEHPTPLPPDHPKNQPGAKQQAVGPETSTVFSVQVTQVLHGDLTAGQRISVAQNGSYYDGIAYQVEHDPLMSPGQTYLLFLRQGPEDSEYLYGTAFGRFEVDSGRRLTTVDSHFGNIPLVRALEGKTIADAAKLIGR